MVAMAGHHVMVIVLISITLLIPSCSVNVTISPRSGTECGIPSTGLPPLPNRIVGGTKADECEYPWVTLLIIDGRFMCGGTILDKRHVLTAAHCVINGKTDQQFLPKDVLVNVGSSNMFRMAEHKVENITVHPNYDTHLVTYDAAVLTLAKDLKFSECVAPVCLPEKGVEVRDTENCVVTGWGVTDPERPSVSKDLLEVELPITDQLACRMSYGAERVPESSLCAGELSGGKDSCQGDSGGPLMCLVGGRYFVHGIVSNGNGCALPGFPGIYTRVAHPEILNFIKAI